jgi:hypothetical protein
MVSTTLPSRAMDLTNSISRNTAAEFRAFGLSQRMNNSKAEGGRMN